MIPESTMRGLRQYVDEFQPVDGFLTAVLSNDLKGAFAQADENNRAAMFEIVRYCYNEMPWQCCGSPDKIEAWLALRTMPRAKAEPKEVTP